jgi:hypothetical protein
VISKNSPGHTPRHGYLPPRYRLFTSQRPQPGGWLPLQVAGVLGLGSRLPAVTDKNRIRLVLFDVNRRIFGPRLAAICRILISVTVRVGLGDAAGGALGSFGLLCFYCSICVLIRRPDHPHVQRNCRKPGRHVAVCVLHVGCVLRLPRRLSFSSRQPWHSCQNRRRPPSSTQGDAAAQQNMGI